MPHECTTCGRTFPDGSKEMLSGCPDCGGNKFQFSPSRDLSSERSESTGGSGSGSTSAASGSPSNGQPDAQPDAESAADSDAASGSDLSTRAAAKRTGARATETVRDWVTRKADENDAAQSSNSETADRDAADQTVDRTADRSAPGTERKLDTSEFPEWPDTARRPEDRTTAPDDSSDVDSGRADSSDVDGSGTPGSSDPRGQSRGTPIADSENSAQADARTGVVSDTDLPSGTVEGDATSARREDHQTPARRSSRDDAAGGDRSAAGDSAASSDVGTGGEVEPDEGRVVSEPSGDRPSIEELREELNEQFESIKIVRPGEYELNLMELYNREEYIISLQEDGRYVIEVPDAWRDGDD